MNVPEGLCSGLVSAAVELSQYNVCLIFEIKLIYVFLIVVPYSSDGIFFLHSTEDALVLLSTRRAIEIS